MSIFVVNRFVFVGEKNICLLVEQQNDYYDDDDDDDDDVRILFCCIFCSVWSAQPELLVNAIPSFSFLALSVDTATTTTFLFCLISLFSADHSRLGRFSFPEDEQNNLWGLLE